MTAASDGSGRAQRRLLTALLALAAGAALRAAASVALPLAFALFLIAIFWPLQWRLEGRVPRGVAAVLTFAVFAAVTGGFVWLLWRTGRTIANAGPEYGPALAELRARVEGLLGGGAAEGDAPVVPAGELARRAGRALLAFAGGAVLVAAYFVLGLLEVGDFRAKLAGVAGKRARTWIDALHGIASDFQRYIVVRTGVGLISGSATGVGALLVGLDLALVWAVQAFLLNYIPTLGSIAAVVAPTVFALATGGSGQALLVLLVLGALQLVTGNTIDPLLQGKYLRLSPLVVLLSVAFWGWMWGIAGAFLGVPITVAVVIACARFPRTRWVATLLASWDGSPSDRLEGAAEPA